MDNYRTIEAKLRSLTPFKGNSMSAGITADGSYEVLSYETPIAYNYGWGTSWITDKRYSTTTTRHLNLVKKAWGLK